MTLHLTSCERAETVTASAMRSPGFYAREGEPYDLSVYIGPSMPHLTDNAAWPMYSYDKPATLVWNAIAAEMHAAGWNDKRIKGWLQSVESRWACERGLGDILTATATEYARREITNRPAP